LSGAVERGGVLFDIFVELIRKTHYTSKYFLLLISAVDGPGRIPGIVLAARAGVGVGQPLQTGWGFIDAAAGGCCIIFDRCERMAEDGHVRRKRNAWPDGLEDELNFMQSDGAGCPGFSRPGNRSVVCREPQGRRKLTQTQRKPHVQSN
jgi:hypothetical protein